MKSSKSPKVVRKSRKSRDKVLTTKTNAVPSANQPEVPVTVVGTIPEITPVTADGTAAADIENFYITAGLGVERLKEPLMLVFKSKKNEISFEKDGDFKVKVKLHSGKTTYPLSYSFTFSELEKYFKSVINKKAGN